jgi:hypothetical protein
MGFEIVDLETLRTRGMFLVYYRIIQKSVNIVLGLLDQQDPSLSFVTKHRKDSMRPIAIFKVKSGDYLLCYNGIFSHYIHIYIHELIYQFTLLSEFAFYVDKSGRRGRGEWIIQWEGVPTSFGNALLSFLF